MDEEKRGEIKIYLNGKEGVSVRLVEETVWLSLTQLTELFERDKSVISRHLRNIFNEGELDKNSVVAKNATTAADGKTYTVDYFNLDAILSVGYRVNSKKATQFRIWANRVLKDYLVKGYAVNETRLLEYRKQLTDAQSIIKMIAEKSHFEIMSGHENQIIDLVDEYAKSWRVLTAYDDDKLTIKKTNKQVKFEITYDGAIEMLGEMRDQLFKLRVNVSLFGQEYGDKLKGITGAINQTFDSNDLYPSVEEKAANLLYLVIKDHPFADGNKRIASMLFIYFLENNDFMYKPSGEKKISDNTLIALALLVATSDPKEKDNMVRLIINLIQN